ncbi:5'-AMP-activated protein kinase beta subunit, interation domain-containing protein [Pseudomassariella vexata]|uniref:5'-AMP-activated protein kinase beta subunit, interation domain-domain-containing protein n=1 Tax=Pseudomassariella vexata TaxID=1141098 RepID=A0A1Y2EI67_9PEZI|nr:5'-AMP-activated protein kinase beta subunit, interation domain-containing protein [Pseudomassariella vexata]ORY71268.1 5'-AMP-activated protein kinase beta subunit, interation domain-domain-containing protein [Pseudomassariella vexata]
MGLENSKPVTPTPPSGGHHANDSPRASKKESKNLITAQLHHHRSTASSPEASVVQAQGSTIGPGKSHSRPLSILNSSSSPSSSSQHSATQKPPATKPRPIEPKDEPSKPVAVPIAPTETSSARSSQYDDPSLTPGPASSSIQDMSYHLSRPPRLPLPIEEEVHTPGSPIIAPADIGEPIDDVEGLDTKDDQGNLPRRSSGLSNATDEEDSEELRVDKTRPTVLTRVEWLQGGQKVYVTGTPFGWARKQRLTPAKGREGVLEATIPVYPGTHHIKFLVDGAMETSRDLPTTVDFGNNLVNYIEVSGPDATTGNITLGATPPKSAKDAEALPSRRNSQTPLDDQPKPPQKKIIDPAETFTGHVPKYLADFDQPEDAKSYQLAVTALDKLPTPPSLPSFLGKPIMNNTTLIKDDNSVLNMPNHTVLNHLATSSIKNNVLAVSATTRYRGKYVTTIIYKPTSEDS